ncbi:MAG: SUMF1/EgtB/PvdO family nonheme iron enzyme [Candidatus Riflebacteria bacterium]|nr:SUMF1/EgtB/PvdO family nonheme iron enzyme [Candidatus Riflebacteria bacterium]
MGLTPINFGIKHPGANPGGSYRVLRGGSWNNNNDNLRSANRDNNNPNNRNNNNGFRVCRPR